MIPVLSQSRRRRPVIAAPGGGGWTPASKAGLQFWFRASDYALADNDAVTTNWTDQSGNGNHATLNGGVTYRTNQVNGKPALKFDGSSGYFTLPTLTLGLLVVVAKYKDGAAGNFTAYQGLFTSTGTGLTSIVFTGNEFTTNWYTATENVVGTKYLDGSASSAAGPLNAWHWYMQSINTPLSQAWLFGRDRNNTGRYWPGYYAELFGYDTGPSGSDLTDIDGYINTEFGI